MKDLILSEWPIFKQALQIAVAIPLSVIFPLFVVNSVLSDTQKPAEEPLPFTF
jgi:hypothetical protein